MRLSSAAWAAGAGLAAWHLAPAATWLPPVRRWFPTLSGRGDLGHVALTFDDGPKADSTPHVLAALADLGLHATFFVLGAAVAAQPELAEQIRREGHELAVHGWDHGYLLGRGTSRIRGELSGCARLVAEVGGQRPVWFRPAYGVLTGPSVVAARQLGLRPVLWTAWARDWTSRATADSVLTRLTPGLTGGATLLLHDADYTTAPGAWRATVTAIPRLVELARRRGLRLGPLREHLH
jgi:peptidoglycan-N-acetylglucosamine deacetylase